MCLFVVLYAATLSLASPTIHVWVPPVADDAAWLLTSFYGTLIWPTDSYAAVCVTQTACSITWRLCHNVCNTDMR
jgi:hypothetical protein